MTKRKQSRYLLISKILSSIMITSILVSLVSLIAGCSQTAQQSNSQRNILKVGMLLGSGGLGDRSFNDSAYGGLLEAQKKFNIRFETVDTVSKESDKNALRFFAQNKYDLIIGIGFEHQETIQTIAREFPQTRFGAIDYELTGDNIASIVYREQEGDFLMGVLAALLTKTKYVGVIGGMDIPAIKRIISGFKQGVTYQDSNIRIFSDIAGTFSDPQVGLKVVLSRYNEGADVIHNAASRTGLGIIQAAQQAGKLTTGTSGDQRYLAPGNVVGNRPKRVDTAVMILVEEIDKQKFKSGIRSLGLKENGISLWPFDENLVNKAVLSRLEDLIRELLSWKSI